MDKKQWAQAIRDYAIQEGFALLKVKNDKVRHVEKCKHIEYSWRIHAVRLADRVTWQVKPLSRLHVCETLQVNSMASHPWVASQLVFYYKANPALKVISMQELLMERFGIEFPQHTYRKA